MLKTIFTLSAKLWMVCLVASLLMACIGNAGDDAQSPIAAFSVEGIVEGCQVESVALNLRVAVMGKTQTNGFVEIGSVQVNPLDPTFNLKVTDKRRRVSTGLRNPMAKLSERKFSAPLISMKMRTADIARKTMERWWVSRTCPCISSIVIIPA